MSTRSQRQIAFYVEPKIKTALKDRAHKEGVTLQQMMEQSTIRLLRQEQPYPGWWPTEHEKATLTTVLEILRNDGEYKRILVSVINLYRGG